MRKCQTVFKKNYHCCPANLVVMIKDCGRKNLLGVSSLKFNIPRVTSSESKHNVPILSRDSGTVNGFCFDLPSAVTRDVQVIATCVE